jgi:hypothetical protein
MHGFEMGLDVPAMELTVVNQGMGCIIEIEIVLDKCQWLVRPGACIIHGRDNAIGHSLSLMSLSILSNSRGSKNTQTGPVIDGARFVQESVNLISAHSNRTKSKALEHANGERFLFWPHDRPRLTLSKYLAQVWVQMELFLIRYLGINNYPGCRHKEIKTLGGSNYVILQALLSKGIF